ncbi:hypothetical protein SAMN05421813_101179 [Daejeonella rubra]|uniref:Uncharacterized protein n=1 Tax=Daejeonella rubra TaxID=990371 RepID=A0A1G9M1M3_9SPHI|nr:hypothetical protein [Daejeonella rubra]SDL67817.1 hypothetical protein SAMN05421813_101179 [Daejeonella rubra]
MKTIYTLATTLLLAFSLSASANDHSNDKPKSLVAVSPFVWGSPDESAPEEIKLLKAKFALVPRAPFVWGDANESSPEVLGNSVFNKLEVPVAPFVWGNADEQAPELEETIEAELL